MKPGFSLLAALVLATVPSPAQKSLAEVCTVQVPDDQRLRDATCADVDGDGRADLVLTSSRGGSPPTRYLRVHLNRGKHPEWGQEPDHILVVDGSAVAFMLADVRKDPGQEIVLLTQTGAFAWRMGQEGRRRFQRLARADVLWQYPHPRYLFEWRVGARDLDGDGLDDLVLPTPGGFVVAWQKRAGDDVTFELSPLLETSDEGREKPEATPESDQQYRRRAATRMRMSLGLDMGFDLTTASSLLEVSDRIPAPMLVDWNGDRKTDLVTQTASHLLVWQQQGGRFAAAPTGAFELPVVADRSRRLDISYSAHVADLNGDHKTDCVVFSGDRRAKKIRTQVQVFLNGVGKGQAAKTAAAPLFGPKGYPQQVLVISGFAGVPRLDDVDGDGRPDLVAGAVRPDLLETITSQVDKRIEAELYVFRNQGGTFSRRADMIHRIKMSAEGLQRARQQVTARFFADVTGDGVRDLLLRDDPQRLRVVMTRWRGGEMSLIEQPLWELKVDRHARVRETKPFKARARVLVLEDRQVLGVTFP